MSTDNVPNVHTASTLAALIIACTAVHPIFASMPPFKANIEAVAAAACADDFIRDRLVALVADANAGYTRASDGTPLAKPGATQAQIQAGSVLASLPAAGPMVLIQNEAFKKPRSAKSEKSTDPRDREWIDVCDALLFGEMADTLLKVLRPTLLSMVDGVDRRGTDPKYQHGGLPAEVLAGISNNVSDAELLRLWAMSHSSHTRILVLDREDLEVPAVDNTGSVRWADKTGAPAKKSIAFGVRIDGLRPVAKAKDAADGSATESTKGEIAAANVEQPDESK
jgi:hypothetical protein